jgi:hypothetical protein
MCKSVTNSDTSCNVFGFFKTPFGLVIGIINNSQFVIKIISQHVIDLHS